MFAGQRPDPTWRQALPPPDDPGPSARGANSVEAKANGVGGDAGQLVIVLGFGLGLIALASIGFVGAFMLRPAPAPEAPAALPPLASAAPPLAEDASTPSQTIEPGRLPGSEPAPFSAGISQQASREGVAPPALTINPAPWKPPLPPVRETAAVDDALPLPPPRPPELAPVLKPTKGYDKWTAIYDISAHSVYLPDGTRLEAHSGLGDRKDDPRFVEERDRGATPPHLYELTLRESLFHGVQALRLTPVGEGFSFERTGLLAHPYMLGPTGASNGCVSFKDYDAFLRAFQDGTVKRLAVVATLTEEPRRDGRLASLWQGLDR